MNNTERRRKAQVAFLETGENIVIGNVFDCPLTVLEIKNLDAESEYVFEVIDSGLTSLNYNIEVDGNKYNVKVKREKILVDNLDGFTSFLNEVQRRNELESIRKSNPIIDRGIVKTIYANLNEGVILSEYINGKHISNYTNDDLKELFGLFYELDIKGFFEWDLCKGNILKTEDSFKLFDFGYMYKFNPLEEFNNEGLSNPGFYPIERFETRSYLHILRDLEDDEAFEKYKILKQETVHYYNRKINFLKANNGNKEVVSYFSEFVNRLNEVLSDEFVLKKEFVKNIYRATKLDIEDDISGKSCSRYTIEKIDYIEHLIKHSFDILRDVTDKTQEEFLNEYEEIRLLAKQYFLENVEY